MSAVVLDASALLAYMLDEPGASDVEEALARTAVIGAADLAEALSKVAERGSEPQAVVDELEQRGVLGRLLAVEPMTAADAVAVAELRPSTSAYGLGLGDRACLALARRLERPVLTADRSWEELQVGVEVRAFR